MTASFGKREWNEALRHTNIIITSNLPSTRSWNSTSESIHVHESCPKPGNGLVAASVCNFCPRPHHPSVICPSLILPPPSPSLPLSTRTSSRCRTWLPRSSAVPSDPVSTSVIIAIFSSPLAVGFIVISLGACTTTRYSQECRAGQSVRQHTSVC